MDYIKVEMDLPKEGAELAVGIGEFVAAVRVALADGWQPGVDVPAIISAALMKIAPAIDGFDKIPAEAKMDPMGMAVAVLHGLGPAFKKPEVA